MSISMYGCVYVRRSIAMWVCKYLRILDSLCPVLSVLMKKRPYVPSILRKEEGF